MNAIKWPLFVTIVITGLYLFYEPKHNIAPESDLYMMAGTSCFWTPNDHIVCINSLNGRKYYSFEKFKIA